MQEYLNRLVHNIRNIKSSITNIEYMVDDHELLESDEEETDPRLVLLYDQLSHERSHSRNMRPDMRVWPESDPDSVICVLERA